ncbi:tRNA glutamyl-Q(34) synthetase GluQRS [Rariglobus hedericola]|uniref:tRNA glutamyl-Q(34) synthetase GluQRS n=1 Tax=Rariglobus hedericola TaxID=2597822 RepID=A0A556QMD1_9BACT|nr:tRNA glutamyl-Q(34) synthetase GluQRS [Rariglobus hedericola]TSJ77809.1 tRNA glutamyl-Q(34) synthetase GluQRS [Rariglobus hedericola]
MVNHLSSYLGRLAPSPTGYLHLGHARTFWIARQRALAAGGRLLLRNDDLDSTRIRADFVDAMIEDLRWLGLTWEEPVIVQSQRLDHYRAALRQLHAAGLIFPCHHSRRELAEASVSAPHEGGDHDEPLYPPSFRPPAGTTLPPLDAAGLATNWRFRVPDGETLTFADGRCGHQSAIAGKDFGDFLVWRKDGVPSYQLACAVDDASLGITEVVRGADLIKSTFRQLLLIRALGHAVPSYYHCPLMLDDQGERLAKRHDSLSLRILRAQGLTSAALLASFESGQSGL